MAEVVQSHIEEMLPEVYEFQQLGILSSLESKMVIKTRTDFEYKMRRRISKKNDFLRFIDFELKLGKLTRARILKFGVNDVSEGARYRSLQRIHFIFQKCLRKHKNDITLWVRYINYCKHVNSSRSLGIAFVEALKHNPTNINLWIMSAKNEMETHKNVSAARALFHQGLKFNNISTKLWTEYFRLEVLHVEKLWKRQQLLQNFDKTDNSAVSSEFLSFKTAKIVYKNALSSITLTSDALNGFICVTENVEGAQSLVRFIYESSLTAKPDDISIWVCLAGFILKSKADPAKALSILRTAAKLINTIQCTCDIINFISQNQNVFEDHLLIINPFIENLDGVNMKSADSVIELGKLLLNISHLGSFSSLLDSALEEFPQNKNLWLFKIEFVSDDVKGDLEKALINIPEDADIWTSYLTILCTTESYEVCKQKWRNALQKKFGYKLLTNYLDLVYAEEGIVEVRKEVKELQNFHPITEAVVARMIELEMYEENFTEVFELFNILCESYGTSEIWKKFILFCENHFPQKVSGVIWKSEKQLN